jgi:hypothetical protein
MYVTKRGPGDTMIVPYNWDVLLPWGGNMEFQMIGELLWGHHCLLTLLPSFKWFNLEKAGSFEVALCIVIDSTYFVAQTI